MMIRVHGWVPYFGTWSTDFDTTSGHSSYTAAQLILNRIIYLFMQADENINRPRKIKQVWAEEIVDGS